MSYQLRQDELYEDLSIILVLIKKIFKNMLLKDNQEELCKSRETINEQTIISSRCTQLIIRYKKAIIRKADFLHIISRFFCRVKEILKQITICIPKERIQILIILKKMELLTLKAITVDTSVSVILSLLEIISNCNIKLIHSLKIKPTLSVKEQRPGQRMLQKQSSFKEDMYEQRLQKVEVAENQLELVMKNLERYSVMGIDKEFFRGRYFDLKTQQNSSIYQENMLRNKIIKNLMNKYQKDYVKHASKSISNYSMIKSSDGDSKKKAICWQITPVEPQSSNLFPPKRENSSRSSNSHRLPLNRSNQTLAYNSMEESAEIGIETYRSMYESKMMKSRVKKTVKMNNTVIDVPNVVANPNANMINAKRWNFYKKSQQHLKFRYKYNQNKKYNTTPLYSQYGMANPQMFYTIGR